MKTIIIGVVEGITEWLPISSTGHMILIEEWLKLDVSKEFWDMFLVVIQLGAILAVVFLFFDKLNPLSLKKSSLEKKDIWILWSKVFVAVLPAAIIGLLLDDWLNAKLYNFVTVSIMLIFYGILFIVIERWNSKRTPIVNSVKELTWKSAFLIGAFQTLALVPGTSRSGATILGAIILGVSRSIAAEFSFFMSIPVMFGASLLKLYKFGFSFDSYEIGILLIGMITAFFISILTIKFLLGYIKKHDFTLFGWYRIVLGLIVVILYFLSK
jgi:undecaprenyl-diphosphatase